MTVRVLVGYDGSPAAGAAIEVGARLMPGATALISHLWTPPFASEALRRRLWTGTGHVTEFVAAIEREGQAEADRLAGVGVILARAYGWDAEPLVHRAYGGEGLELAQLAGTQPADVVLVGSRGLGGARAVLGSVSDMVAHYAPQPVLVVPFPLLVAERRALEAGPVMVGWDGSPGAAAAVAAAGRLLPGREIVPVAVDDGTPVTEPLPDGARLAEPVRVPGGHGAAGRRVAEALGACAADRRAALLVVGSRGRSALREIVLGSVALATLHHVFRPVLVVPSPDGAAA